MKRIAGLGLQAVLRENGSVVMIDSSTSREIVTIRNPTKRITVQFNSNANHRAGQNSESKMNIILECLEDVPEMDDYL